MPDLIKKTDGEIISLRQISDIEFTSRGLNDSQVTIREWLKELLATVWQEKDIFSGKRPWGDSGWEYDIYTVLIENNIITGTIDEYGDIEKFDDFKLADKIILDIIVEVM